MTWAQHGMILIGKCESILKDSHQHLYRAIGQCFMMGWEGDQVTPQIRSLIADYGLGSIILTAKNLKCRPILVLMATDPFPSRRQAFNLQF